LAGNEWLSIGVIQARRIREVRSVLVSAAILVLFAGPAASQGGLTGYTGEVTMQGKIVGANKAQIFAYKNGFPVSSAESAITGAYSIKFEVSGQEDETVVVWFIPDNTMVPELVILKESSNARRYGVWSPCLPRHEPEEILLYDVQFKTERELLKQLEGDDCFEQQVE